MRRSLLVFIAASSVLAAACSGATGTGGGSDTGEGRSDAPEAAPAPAANEATTLDFTAPAVDGGTVRGADYAGDALAIWFWAPW
ncbi:MAG: hypothetical protein R6X23_12880 [Acidimicrobiia bacterium]